MLLVGGVRIEIVTSPAQLLRSGFHLIHPVRVASPVKTAGVIKIEYLKLQLVDAIGAHDVKLLVIGKAIKCGIVLFHVAQTFVADAQIVGRAAGHGVTSLDPGIQCGINGRCPTATGQSRHINALIRVMVLYIIHGHDEWLEEEAERAVEIIEHLFVRIERDRSHARHFNARGHVRVEDWHVKGQHRKSFFEERRDDQTGVRASVIHPNVLAQEPGPEMARMVNKKPSVASDWMKVIDV